jgi:hypothetical protein
MKRVIPTPETVEHLDASPIIHYPNHIGKDDTEAKRRYSLLAAEAWGMEVKRLEGGEEEGEGKREGLGGNHAKRRNTMTAAADLRSLITSPITQDDATSQPPTRESTDSASVRQTVIRSSLRTLRGGVDNSVGRLLLGNGWKGSYLLRYAFALVLYSAGALLACLALWNFIPRPYIYSVVLCIPYCIFNVLTFNVDICRLVMRQQSNMIFWFWATVLIASLSVEYYGQDHYAGIIFLLVLLLWSVYLIPMFDSLPLHERAITNKLLAPICNMLLMVWVVSLSYNWAMTEGYFISIAGHIRLTAAGLATSAINNVVVLMTLNIYSIFRYPTRLVSVRSEVEALQMSEGEAVSLRSYDALSHEIAERNRVGGRVGLRKTLKFIFNDLRRVGGRG